MSASVGLFQYLVYTLQMSKKVDSNCKNEVSFCMNNFASSQRGGALIEGDPTIRGNTVPLS